MRFDATVCYRMPAQAQRVLHAKGSSDAMYTGSRNRERCTWHEMQPAGDNQRLMRWPPSVNAEAGDHPATCNCPSPSDPAPETPPRALNCRCGSGRPSVRKSGVQMQVRRMEACLWVSGNITPESMLCRWEVEPTSDFGMWRWWLMGRRDHENPSFSIRLWTTQRASEIVKP